MVHVGGVVDQTEASQSPPSLSFNIRDQTPDSQTSLLYVSSSHPLFLKAVVVGRLPVRV